jgi:hypothetical protein
MFTSRSNIRSIRIATTTGATLLLLGVVTIAAFGQSYYGGIRGAVSDQNGGAVTAAKVTLVNEGTAAERSTITGGSGEYVFSEVVPGNYTLISESPGFKRFERKGVTVATQQQVSVDLKLELGQVTESVQVTEEVALVETTNASQGQVLDNQKLTELPNLGRNPFMMSKLVQNVVQVGNPAYNRMEDQSGSSQISISGGPVRGNNYLIDGVPITDANNRAIIIPSLEAVQEVKIQANTYDAEMARTGGGMFNTLMKSGANDYHGSVYGHLRRTSWDANSFFNNANGIPITDQPNDTWGASFGGKVWIPKIYDGKNKTFFYLAFEHYDDIQSSSSLFATPTALERKGDFSQSGITIYDPLAPLDSKGNRAAFANNIIPASRLNPVGLALASYYANPQYSPSGYGSIDLAASGRLPCRAAQWTGKIDEDFTSWWRASVSYLRYYSLEPGDTWFNNPSTPGGWLLERRVDSTQINSLFTINPTTILTVRYGFNRFPNYSYNTSQGFDLASLGLPASFVNQIPRSLAQFPVINMTSLYSLGVDDNNSFYVHASNNFSTSVAKFMGRHSLKAGLDYRRIKAAGNDANNAQGDYTFNGIFTQSNPTSTGTGGADLADLLLGYPASGNIYASTKLTDFADYYGAYIQDDFRVTPKLTLNLGLRWERELGLQEQNNGMIVNFNIAATNPLGAKGVVEYAGNGKTTVGNWNSNKFGPRVSVAYQVNSKTVVRGGYGLFWAPQFQIGAPIATPGYNATTSYIASNDGFYTPVGSISNPYPNGIAQPAGNSLGASTGIGQTFSLIDPRAKSPRVHQFSIDIQRELPFGIAAELAYVGSRSNHMVLGAPTVNGNALDPSLLSQGSALLSQVANPYYGNRGTGILSGPTVQASQLLRPFPAFNNINYLYNDVNHARYDSMVLKAQKRLSQGLTFLTTLTWSRNWDMSSGGPGNTLNAGQKAPQNPYNLAGEYSFANIDTPFNWATSISYELPVGKGKPFLNHGGFLDYALGGWAINTVSVFRTGFPLQITQSTNYNSSFGYASQRPNATGVSPETSGSLTDRLNNYINPAAFSIAPEFTFGNVGRTIDMRGPGMANWDMSIFKTFTIKERLKAQFRAEALNAMNTSLFYGPNVSFGSSNFGNITSQANFSRQLQLAVRATF